MVQRVLWEGTVCWASPSQGLSGALSEAAPGTRRGHGNWPVLSALGTLQGVSCLSAAPLARDAAESRGQGHNGVRTGVTPAL